MEMNNSYYLPNPTPYHLRQLGFHYSSSDECFVFTFSIIRYNNKPTLLCKIFYNYNKLDNKIIYDILKPNNELLALYYNQDFGNAKGYVKKINSIIDRRMKAMGFKKRR